MRPEAVNDVLVNAHERRETTFAGHLGRFSMNVVTIEGQSMFEN